tara:strand:+ start:28228 stop:28671 length:444 start_codon:yes stop_codon:yes gene_type:complete
MSNSFKDLFAQAWAYLAGNLKLDGDEDLQRVSLDLQLLFHNKIDSSTNSPVKTKELEQKWMDARMFVSFKYPHNLRIRYIDDTFEEYTAYLTTTSKNIILRGSNGMTTTWDNVHPITKQMMLNSVKHAKKPEHYPESLYYFFMEKFI